MINTLTPSPATGKKHRWLKILGGLAGSLILLLVVTYFTVTSSVFFKSFILPRISKTVNASVTVETAAISPFSQIILWNLKIQTAGNEPLITVQEVRVRYHLMAILGGNLNVDEIALIAPAVNLIDNADGTSNVDPLLKSLPAKKAKPASPADHASPTRLNLKKLELTNATLRKTKNHSGGQRNTTELANVNLTLTDLQNGHSGKLKLGANVKVANQPSTPEPGGTLQANVSGDFAFTLAADLKPVSIQGNTHLAVTQAGGTLGELAALAVDLDYEVTPTEIKNVALRFQKNGKSLGGLYASGPFNPEKSEGNFNVELRALDREVLNLAGAANGLDFGSTTINSTNQIALTKAGTVIMADGRLTIARLQVTRARQTTPALDALVDYHVTVDSTAQTALLRMLTVNATQNHNPLLQAELSSPMTLAWGSASNAVSDAVLNITLTGLELADWKPFLGETASGGRMDLKAKLLSQLGGKQLTFDLDSQIANIAARLESNQLAQTDVKLRAHGQAVDFKQFKLDDFSLQVTRPNESLLTASGTGICDTVAQTADMQVRVQASLPGLLQVLPQPNATISSGTIELTGRVTQQAQTQTLTGQLTLADLTGRLGQNQFRSFGIRTDLDVTKTGGKIQISKASGKFTEGVNAGGAYDVSGNYNLDNNSGQLTAKLTDLNQNGLRPFLEPLLGDKRLVSAIINATATAQFDPQADSTVKASLKIANLVVNGPKGQFPTTPLETKWQLDAGLHNHIADIRQCQIILTPTSRAKNELQLTGQVDLSQTNAITGTLKLAADTLDMTGYYDLFGGKSAAQPAPVAPAVPREEEPAATHLPFKNFTVDATIARLYLHEVDVANFQTTLKLDRDRVLLQPFQMSLNGRPVNGNADLNLSVPGYQYDVSFTAIGVPIAPLADSFSPAYKGQAKGDLFANAKIKGAGITGGSFQKYLEGNANLRLTNANIQLTGPKAKLIITPIALGLGLEELTRASLTGLNAQLKIGDGQIALTQCDILGEAFCADVTGEMSIAPAWNDSRFNNWPINFALSRNLAAKAHLLSSDTTTNAMFIKLPTFAKLGGTFGKPEAKIDKLVLAGLIARSVGGIPGVVGGDAGKVLQGLGSLLGGQTQPAASLSTDQTTTNSPPSSPSKPINLFDLFKKK